MKFLLPFLISFFISIFAIWFLLRLKNKAVRRMGGVAVIIVFVLLVLLDKNLVITGPIAGILVGGLLVLLFGLWDDLKNLDWKWQLLFQIIIAVTAISFGVRSEYVANPFGGIIYLKSVFPYFLFFTLYFLLFINSLNWLDGVDGLAGSVTLAALGVVFFLSLLPHVNQPAVAILCAIAGGSVLGFLIFNWHPAHIIAGTSGAWFFGFILASFSIFAGAKIATVLTVAFIPILDFLRVIWERFRAGRPVFSGGDNRHLHHKLVRLGLKEREIVIVVAAASVLIGVIAINFQTRGKFIFMVLFAMFYFWTLSEIKKKIAQKNK